MAPRVQELPEPDVNRQDDMCPTMREEKEAMESIEPETKKIGQFDGTNESPEVITALDRARTVGTPENRKVQNSGKYLQVQYVERGCGVVEANRNTTWTP